MIPDEFVSIETKFKNFSSDINEYLIYLEEKSNEQEKRIAKLEKLINERFLNDGR